MSKKWLIALLVLLAVGAAWYLKGDQVKEDADDVLSGGTQGGAVTYTCDAGKSFTLTYVDADTSRLSGTGITSTNLRKNTAGYWVNSDGKTQVKQVGSYVVLVQSDLTTHDRCSTISPGRDQ